MVDVGGAPVVVADGVFFSRPRGRGGGIRGEIVQQPRLGSEAGFHDVREIPGLVTVDIGLGITITGLGDQRGGVDDQRAKRLNAGPEAGQLALRRPDVWCCVLG